MMRMDILCATDDGFAQHCGVMLCSLFENNKGHDVVAHVVESGLSDENKARLKKVAERAGQTLLFHHLAEGAAKDCLLHERSAVTEAAYYRLFVASLITDASIERVVYLDCDMIVRHDLAPLFRYDMSAATIAAVRDINNPMYAEHSEQLGFAVDDAYFNSGMLVINLRRWRDDGMERVLVAESAKPRKIFFPDQDVLNKVFRRRWTELPPKWNRFHLVNYTKIHFRRSQDEIEYVYDPAIVHFASNAARPWMHLRGVPFADEYDRYASLTPWAGYEKREMPDRRRRERLIRCVRWNNAVYRSPYAVRAIYVGLMDLALCIYHLVKHRGSLHLYRHFSL